MKRSAILLFFILIAIQINANTKRALVIGIDIYFPTAATPPAFATAERKDARGGWHNLDGCVNDARAIKSLIMARYGFEEKNIDTLINQDANRKNILDAIQKLIDGSQPGDVVFIYYAGHGSQVKNSLSYDSTKHDQTIVPADLNDIRNKELSKLFNDLQKKGVKLTLIFDSCHSGAIARGNQLPTEGKTRYQWPVDAYDAKDPAKYPAVEENGALVFSAAQREQFANESSEDNIPHGAFTLAFLRAINASSVNESAERIYQRLLAAMKVYTNKVQDPILAGNDERRKEGLFGDPVNSVSSRTMVSVSEVSDGEISLRGGFELNIYPGSRFIKSGGKDTVEVKDVLGIGSSKAQMCGKGNIATIKPGDLLEMINFVYPDEPALRVWSPPAKFTKTELQKAIQPVLALFSSSYFISNGDPAKVPAQFVIQHDGTRWLISGGAVRAPVMLSTLTDAELKKIIPKGSNVFLQLPPSKELDVLMRKKLGKDSPNSAVNFESDPQKADYILAGRSAGASFDYCFLRPNLSFADANAQTTMPIRTNWFSLGMGENKISDSLSIYAVRLGKIHSWLKLESSEDDFPYQLFIKSGGKLKTQGDSLVDKDLIELYLVRDSSVIKPEFFTKRFIYIFVLDSSGQMQLLYPLAARGNEGNTVAWDGAASPYVMKLKSPKRYTVGAPFGYDTYFMVTSEVPLSTDVFESEGVLTRSGTKGATNPLNEMLQNYGARTRSVNSEVIAVEWSIQKITLVSVPQKNN